jgi:hypothetical protein
MDSEEDKTARGCVIGAAGCAGVFAIVLVGAFAALFYFGFVQRGGVYDGLRLQLAQSQLNQLVPYVELYRTQRGSYPETIDQLTEIIPPVTVVGAYDPSAPPTGAPRKFHYERVDADHYILRGVGADGEVFTEDDIVPQGFEAGGLGLLLERPAAPAQSPGGAASPQEGR